VAEVLIMTEGGQRIGIGRQRINPFSLVLLRGSFLINEYRYAVFIHD